MPADGRWDLTWRLNLVLLTWRIWWAPNNASRWQMGFNSEFKRLNKGLIRITSRFFLSSALHITTYDSNENTAWEFASIAKSFTHKIFGKCVAIIAMRARMGNRSEAPLILNLDVPWGWMFKVKYRPLHRQKKVSRIHCREGQGDARPDWTRVVKRKRHARFTGVRTSNHPYVMNRYNNYTTPAPKVKCYLWKDKLK